MPLPEEIKKQLETIETLKTFKVGDKQLIDYLAEIHEKADHAIEIQTANKEISTERKTLKARVEELEKLKVDMDKKLSEISSKDFSSNGELKYNKVLSDLTALQTELHTVRDEQEKDKKEKLAAKAESAIEKLDNKLITALTAKNITGNNLKVALHLIKGEQLAIIDNTSLQEIVKIPLGDGKFKESSIEEVANFISTNYQNLIAGSGKQGTGVKHVSSTTDTNNESIDNLRSQASQTLINGFLRSK
jgi:hypothetical protein